MFRLRPFCVTTLLLALALLSNGVTAQQLDRIERERWSNILKNLRAEVKKNYFDENFKGVDMETRFSQAEEKIRAATSSGQARSAVAWALDGLNDSHTFFIPPTSTAKYSYGWRMDMIGDACFITAVRPKSDAEKQGVKPGDEILKLNGYKPRRADIDKMRYFFNVLQPQPALRLELRSPEGTVRTVQPLAQMRARKAALDSDSDIEDLFLELEKDDRANESRYVEMGEELMIWNLPDFGISESLADGAMDMARKHKALILDLRGNPGGLVKTLNRLVGNFFDHEVKIGDLVGRKEKAKDLKPQLAKPRGKFFTGKLIVLVDSASGSAAELFARIVQLEKRGTVIGDVSAGAVMRAMQMGMTVDESVFYAVSITNADVIMSDGKSLEHVGVAPDTRMLPTAADMAAGRDPVLAHAAELLGVKLTPDAAGKLFPVRWVNP